MSKNQTFSLNKEQLEVVGTLCGEGKKYPSKYALYKEAVEEKLEKETKGEEENERERDSEPKSETPRIVKAEY